MTTIPRSKYGEYNLDHHPSIHVSGSIRGMKKRGFWRKTDIIVRCGSYYYNLSIFC